MWKIVIQDGRSFCYLQKEDAWSFDARTARAFVKLQDAAHYVAAAGLKHAHIVMGLLDGEGRFVSTSKTVVRPGMVRYERDATMEEVKLPSSASK